MTIGLVRAWGPLGDIGIKADDLPTRDRCADHAFSGLNPTAINTGDEGASDTLAFRTTRTSDAVGIGFRSVWHIEVNHMGNTSHVYASSHDVRGYKDIEATGAEPAHGAIALGLGHGSLKTYGSVSIPAQLMR